MTNYIFSTLAANTKYTGYHELKEKGGLLRIAHQVEIKGGAGVADKNFFTPLGVVTQVNDSDLEFLKENVVFKRHLDRGFVRIDSKNQDIEKAVSSMTGRDNSAPIVPQDYEDGQAPKTNKADEDLVIASRKKQNKFNVSSVRT